MLEQLCAQLESDGLNIEGECFAITISIEASENGTQSVDEIFFHKNFKKKSNG